MPAYRRTSSHSAALTRADGPLMKTPGEISKSQRVRNPQTAGMSLKDHLARVAEEKEHDLLVRDEPEIADSFTGWTWLAGLQVRLCPDLRIRLEPGGAHGTVELPADAQPCRSGPEWRTPGGTCGRRTWCSRAPRPPSHRWDSWTARNSSASSNSWTSGPAGCSRRTAARYEAAVCPGRHGTAVSFLGVAPHPVTTPSTVPSKPAGPQREPVARPLVRASSFEALPR